MNRMRSNLTNVMGAVAGALAAWFLLDATTAWSAENTQRERPGVSQKNALPAAPVVAKAIVGPGQAEENLLRPRAWAVYGKGFERQESWFVCDNGTQQK